MIQVFDPVEWQQALAQLPDPHVLQSWAWGEFKERHGWRAARWLWKSGERPHAAALLLTRRLVPLPFCVAYVPKGPLLDWEDDALLDQVLSDLESVARRRRAVLLKIDPDVQADSGSGSRVVAHLTARGWRLSSEQVQFRNTMHIDLTLGEDELLARMKSKWRYNIRLASRSGVQVRQGGAEDMELLYQMYRETSLRDRFVIRPQSYYQDAWGAFIAAGLAQPLIAEVDGEAVAMVILFRLGQRAWYMYGASRSLHRDKMPNHLLQWEAIRWAKAQGCTVYDLWGAPDELVETDPMWGVYRFKGGFGARLVRHIGAYDYPAAPLLYWFYMTLTPRLLAWMRSLHWRRQEPRQLDLLPDPSDGGGSDEKE